MILKVIKLFDEIQAGNLKVSDGRIKFNPLLYSDKSGLLNYFLYQLKLIKAINQAYLIEIPYKVFSLKQLKNSYLKQLKKTENIYKELTHAKDYKDYIDLRDKLDLYIQANKKYKQKINSVVNDRDLKSLKDTGFISNDDYWDIKNKLLNSVKNYKFEDELIRLKKEFDNHKFKPKVITTKKGYKFVKINAKYSIFENRIIALKSTIKLIEYKIRAYNKDLNQKNNYLEPKINYYDIVLFKKGKISDNIQRFLKFKIRKDNKVSDKHIILKNSKYVKEIKKLEFKNNFEIDNKITNKLKSFRNYFHSKIL